MTTLGKKFIASLLDEGSVKDLLDFGQVDHLFKQSEIVLFDFVMKHAKEYHALPKATTVEAHLNDELPAFEESPAYYIDLLKLRFTESEVRKAMKKASDQLMPEAKDPDAALDTLTGTVMQLVAQKHQHKVVDFRDAYDLLVQNYVAQYTGDDDGISLGWPTLDDMTGGIVRGDLLSIVGRIAKGKTWQLLYCLHNAWLQGRPVMMVSMEMKPLPIEQRLIALHASIPHDKIKKAALSTSYLTKMKMSLTEIKGFEAPLWVVDGNFTATVEDIWVLARQLQPAAIYIDGAYLLKHPTERDRYKRVAENADLIKQVLSDLCPVVASWQFSRDAAKKGKKGGQQTGLEDIGYTDAIGQASSLVIGLFEQDSVETMKRRHVRVLKGRNGEVGDFSTRWDFQKMDFSEVEEEKLEDLQFV